MQKFSTSYSKLKVTIFTNSKRLFKSFFIGLLFNLIVFQNSNATIYIVSNCLSQYGVGSIDDAINLANSNVNLDTIVFTCNTINLSNKLYINNPVVLEGYKALSPACGPDIRTQLTYTGGGVAIQVNNTSNVTIRGFVITGTGINVGIEVDNSTNCKIEGNYIGITADGLSLANIDIRNNAQAIWLQGGSGHTIGGATCRERNVISNYNMCIELKGSSNNTLINNYLGVDYLGSSPMIDATYTALPYTVEYNSFGIHIIDGSANAKIYNNVIGSRRKYGIFFDKTYSNSQPGDNPIIRGNIVGIGADNTTKIGNGWVGIFLQRVQKATIGGPLLKDRNYSGNNGYLPQGIWETKGFGHGIQLTELAGSSTIENNVTGVSPDGKTPMPNAQDGISLLGSSGNTIKNNISKWNTYGIFLQGVTNYGNSNLPIQDVCANNRITGNTIKFNGYNPQNNTEGGGIGLQFSSYNNMVGVDSTGLGNLVDSNLTGITLRNDRITSTSPALLTYGAWSNKIYNNTITRSTSAAVITSMKYKEMLGVGIVIHGNGSDNNFIGGSQPLQANTITQNASNGIYIETGVKNWVFPQNLITCNGGTAGAQGIKLAKRPGGNTAEIIGNDNFGSTSPFAGRVTVNTPNTGAVDASDSIGANYLYKGYAPANSRVYIYLADACATCGTAGSNGLFKQGQTLKDSVFANGSGIWQYSLAKPVGNGIVVYAAETSGANRNTSEFSQCFTPLCIPPSSAIITPANPAIVCKGTNVTLTASPVKNYIYTWYKGTSIVSGPTKNGTTYEATTSGSYSVRIGDPSNPGDPLCSLASSPVILTVSESSVGGVATAAQSPICPNNSTAISISGYKGNTIQWQQSADSSNWTNVAIGSENATAIYTTPKINLTTYYRALITNGPCKADSSKNATVVVLPVPAFKLQADTIICEGTTLSLSAPAGFQKYIWSNGSVDKTIAVIADGTFWLKAETTSGCPVADTVIIGPCNILKIYNIISPNNDPYNQYFVIQGNQPNSQLQIFNRWGTRVYNKDNYDNSWDGEGLSDGIYYYIYKRPNDKEAKSGWVEIVGK
jgi:gliding motility-associated-like protein